MYCFLFAYPNAVLKVLTTLLAVIQDAPSLYIFLKNVSATSTVTSLSKTFLSKKGLIHFLK